MQEEYLQLRAVLPLSVPQPPSIAQAAISNGEQRWSPPLRLSPGARFLPRGLHLSLPPPLPVPDGTEPHEGRHRLLRPSRRRGLL